MDSERVLYHFYLTMKTPIISASSYSNTAPLIWSFLYGSSRGKYEMILDTAPARSAELLANSSIDVALVPIIAYQMIEDVKLIPDVCVGAKEKVRSVCLITNGMDLSDVKSVALDISSKTSVVLTKIIFREFLGFEPIWIDAEPNLDNMLADSDCALLIGDPALVLSEPSVLADKSRIRKVDLVELWREFTGFGFVFAMWMTKKETCEIDFAAARDEGIEHLGEILANYEDEISLSQKDFKKYLTKDISFSINESMNQGMKLYFKLAKKNDLIEKNLPIQFV